MYSGPITIACPSGLVSHRPQLRLKVIWNKEDTQSTYSKYNNSNSNNNPKEQTLKSWFLHLWDNGQFMPVFQKS